MGVSSYICSGENDEHDPYFIESTPRQRVVEQGSKLNFLWFCLYQVQGPADFVPVLPRLRWRAAATEPPARPHDRPGSGAVRELQECASEVRLTKTLIGPHPWRLARELRALSFSGRRTILVRVVIRWGVVACLSFSCPNVRCTCASSDQ